MVGSYRIQFINKSSRPNSQELSPEDQASQSITNHSNNSMDSVFIYAAAGPAPVKMVKRRESRIRSSFFGSGRRGSCDLAPEEAETSGMKSPSRSMTSSTSDDKENSSFLNRRKLRKSTSHASLASISTAYEAQRQEKLGRRGFTDLLRGGGKQTPPTRPSIGRLTGENMGQTIANIYHRFKKAYTSYKQAIQLLPCHPHKLNNLRPDSADRRQCACSGLAQGSAGIKDAWLTTKDRVNSCSYTCNSCSSEDYIYSIKKTGQHKPNNLPQGLD